MTALAYLRSIEWKNGRQCPSCLHYKPGSNPTRIISGIPKGSVYDHTSNCTIASAIADAEELEKRRGLRTREEISASLHKGPAHDSMDHTLRWVLGEE